MLSGTTTTRGERYHQTWQHGSHIVAQMNRHGEWHGYIGGIWQVQFDNESEAVKWVRDHELSGGVVIGESKS